MERLLEIGEARVRPAEHRDLVVRNAGPVQLAHLLDDECRVVGHAPNDRLRPALARRTQHLRPAEGRHDAIREREHLGCGSVVRLEPDDGRGWKALGQRKQVLRRRARERVDRLVVVADGAELVARPEPPVEQLLLQEVDVGDDYQSIYAFTGATPEYLLALPKRLPTATVVRLESNYRSTPEVLALANRIVPALGGAEKVLRASRQSGPEPVIRRVADDPAFVVEQVRELHGAGVAYDEIAVLCRTNARLADFEEPFHDAQIPFQGAALLSREAARQLLKRPAG